MNTSIKSILFTATVGMLVACGGSQPAPPCAVGHGGFAAKFTQTGCVSGNCATGSCNRPGDIIGVQKYRQTNGDQTVVLRSTWLTEEVYGSVNPLGNDPLYVLSSGKLAADRAEANYCSVPTLTDSTGTDPNGDDLTYSWSDVKFYMSGEVPGTQFTAKLRITSTGTGACTADYTVDAIYPVITCVTGAILPNRRSHIDAERLDACVSNDEQSASDEGWWSGLTANPKFDLACGAIRKDTEPDWSLQVWGFDCHAGSPTGGTAAGCRAGDINMKVCLPTKAVPSFK